MSAVSTIRRIGTLSAATALVVALVAAPVAAGARHASATFVDASGATIGWAKLVEDGSGRVHVNVHVKGLTPGLHGIHIHSVGACDAVHGGRWSLQPGHA